MPPRALVALVLACLVAPACGDDGTFPRDEFVDQVTAGGSGISEEVANCAYDAIVDDRAVMDDIAAADGPNDEVSAATDRKLTRIVAQCVVDPDGSDEPSASDRTTTTERDRDRTTTTERDRDRERTTTTSKGRDGDGGSDRDRTTTTERERRPTATLPD